MTILERDAIIAGVGMSTIGRRTGIAGIDLTEAAARAAIADAGLTVADVDGVATMGDTPLGEACARLGIEPGWKGGGFDTGGLLSPLMSAFWAVGSGKARHVLVYRTVQMMGGSILPSEDAGAPASEERAEALAALDWVGPLLTMHAYSAANWVAMHCRRHMELYGTTKEQLGWLAVTSRRHASLNPAAAYREPMTLDDYLAARPISDPFGLYDCDVPVDGSIALVVSHADRAPDCPNPAVRVHAIGGATGEGAWDQRPDYPKMASADAAAQMWSRSELTPGDVDVAELYDGFTFLTFAWLEALGLCGEGESGPFVEGGQRITIGGELPLNTYGGQLSAGRMHGYWVVHEAVLQLRGAAGERQVPGAEVAAVSAGGGPIAGCMLLTR
ncbi:MAG: thiolase family protein [Acidimicrobiia bacterium]|nr:thiolase family protein [Acidimicrobiia bacterium]